METTSATSQLEDAVYRKITWRIMPFLFLCYVLAYVDRINVGFAKLQMQQDLGMSDSIYGIGAGIFFIGYFIFEVPANLMLQKIGARRWIGPIMIAWGIVSACTLFVQGKWSFYSLSFPARHRGVRLLSGCGPVPDVLVHRKHRARMIALFMSAIPISGILAGPISGWILAQLSGTGHLAGWQWLFLVEGIPSVIAGVVTLYYLTDRPSEAKWLTEGEKKLVLLRLEEEEELKKKAGHTSHRLIDAFKSMPVWLLCLVYFGMTAGNYGITFWLPQVIKETLTQDLQTIGLLSAIPGLASVVAMILWGRHSDKTGERRWHLALAAIVGTAAFGASAIPGISGAAGLARSDDSVRRVDVPVRGLLVTPDRHPVGIRSCRRNRVDQLRRESGRLREPSRGRLHPRSDAQHDACIAPALRRPADDRHHHVNRHAAEGASVGGTGGGVSQVDLRDSAAGSSLTRW